MFINYEIVFPYTRHILSGFIKICTKNFAYINSFNLHQNPIEEMLLFWLQTILANIIILITNHYSWTYSGHSWIARIKNAKYKYQRCTVHRSQYPGRRAMSIRDKYSEVFLLFLIHCSYMSLDWKTYQPKAGGSLSHWQLITANFDLESFLQSDRSKYFEIKMKTLAITIIIKLTLVQGFIISLTKHITLSHLNLTESLK